MKEQLPLSMHGAGKADLRTQFAALCYRVKAGKLRILLVTSRRSERWIVPKGWPMDGKSPQEAVEQEAWEEAGVTGDASSRCLGVYTYRKARGAKDSLSCLAMLYPVDVKSLAKVYPESKERKRRWVSRKKAARLVEEPELSRLILDFDPQLLKGPS